MSPEHLEMPGDAGKPQGCPRTSRDARSTHPRPSPPNMPRGARTPLPPSAWRCQNPLGLPCQHVWRCQEPTPKSLQHVWRYQGPPPSPLPSTSGGANSPPTSPLHAWRCCKTPKDTPTHMPGGASTPPPNPPACLDKPGAPQAPCRMPGGAVRPQRWGGETGEQGGA